jgi:hypothetical protein
VQPPGFDQGAQRLAHEEHVAARPAIQDCGEFARARIRHIERALHQLVRLIPRERQHAMDVCDARREQRLLERPKLRPATPLQLVVRAHDQQRRVAALPRQEEQQLERGEVRPVHVVEQQQQRLPRRQRAHEFADRPQQPAPQLRRVFRVRP